MTHVGSVDDIIMPGDLNYDISLQNTVHTVQNELCDSLGFMNVI